MKTAQRVVLILGTIAFVGTFLYAPWTLKLNDGRAILVFDWLFSPPAWGSFQTPHMETSVTISLGTLALEWLVVFVATGGLFMALGSRSARPAVGSPPGAGDQPK